MQHRIALVSMVAFIGAATGPVLAAPDKAPTPAAQAAQKDSTAHARPSPVPEGFVEMFVAGVLPTEGGPAVVLRDKTEKTLLPIWIGTSEAHSIQLRLERRRFPRPLTHDLLDAIVHDLGGEIVKIHVDDLKGDTFVGTVFVKRGDKLQHFDARPSDSIALAVGNSAPIYVSQAVIDRISSRSDEPEKEPASKEENEPDDPPTRVNPPKTVQTL